jgi:carboxypeptidase family protein/TonB-dependent receptor-like protein
MLMVPCLPPVILVRHLWRTRCAVATAMAAAMLLVAGNAGAQSVGATLQGTISDPQGAVMPGAMVIAKNVETGWTREQPTDERGWYRIPALPPGKYELRAELPGFSTQIRQGLTLTTGQEATVNLTLQLATVQEALTVTGESPLIETSRNTLGTTVTRNTLDTLPLAGRNFSGLATLAPGIAGVGGGGVNAAGQTTRSNSYMVDGVSNDQIVTAGQRGGFSLEAVREFAVMSNQFSAEFGLASGAVVSVITRSGTNELQGRVFAFHRDDTFDAQNPFSKAQGSGQSPFSEQRYGGFLGGPILRDKLFYFGSYEGDRERTTSVITSPAVPVSERETPNPSDGHQAFAKIDQRLGSSHTLTVRYRADKSSSKGDGIGGLNSRERGTNSNTLNQDIVANETFVISSRALNEVRFQFARQSTFTNTNGWSLDGMPEINRPTLRTGKAYNMPQGRDENRWQVINNFSYSWPAHDFKAGVDVSIIHAPSFFPRYRDGSFTFSTDRPFDPNDQSTYPTQFIQAVSDPWVRMSDDIFGLFLQDAWRLRTNLTINAGIRYDRENAFSKINGVKDDLNNWAPRAGFVWDPTGAGRMAIRGGAGIYVDQSFLNPPLNVALAQRARDTTIISPGYPDPFSRGTLQLPSTSIAADQMLTPETRTVSLGVKREIVAGLAVSIDGIYSRGYNQYNNRDVNPPDPVTRVRPDPRYLRVTRYETAGHSWYSAMLASVEHRAGKYVPAFGVSYTLSRTLRDVEGFLFLAQDQNNPAAEKGLGDNHRQHQVAAHTTWTIPGGFQIAAVAQARSGRPWTVTTGVDSNGDTNINDRPDLAVPGGNPRDRATYFTGFTGRVGNLGRNTAIGDPYFTIDARVSKFVKLQRWRVEGFVEAFNATNRVNYGQPVGNLRSSSFGRPTSIQGSPRQVELGLRVDF